MKPFSAGYFIKENKRRGILLIFMFALTYIAYLGGLYVSNIACMYNYSVERMEKFAIIYPAGSDDEYVGFKAALDKVSKEKRITVLQEGVISSLVTKNIMQFNNSHMGYAFRSVEDFKTYCNYMGIQCDFGQLKKGSFIASRLAADNRGMKVGDALKENSDIDERVYGTYTLDAITDEEGYSYYYINDETNYNCMLLPTGMTAEEFKAYTQELKEEFNVEIFEGQSYDENIHKQLDGFNVIYIFIVILLAVVMAITINAAFIGMYQHRQPEFAIYMAIGIPKRKVVGKVIKELLLIDLLGIITGGVVMFLGIYLLNELYLIPKGMQLFYYHSLSLLGMIVCNLVVWIPLVITRSRQLLKADICEY